MEAVYDVPLVFACITLVGAEAYRLASLESSGVYFGLGLYEKQAYERLITLTTTFKLS